jgi:hypothetical protein
MWGATSLDDSDGWSSNRGHRLFFRRRNPPADLLHQRQKIAYSPVVGDLAVLDAHDIDRVEVYSAVSWSDSEKRPFMRAVVRLVGCHSIAIGKLPVDLRMKVRKCGTKIGVECSHTGLVGSRAGLRCVIDEIVSEQFLETIELSPPLDFFRISADNRFGRFRQSDAAHLANLLDVDGLIH